MEPVAWKLTGESKSIQGYACQQATFHDETRDRKIEAWFTPSLACPSGPESFGQLPGLILEVSIDEGATVYTATKVELKTLEADAIQAPTKGKEITQEKYDKMLEERMREMNGQGGGGNHSIRIIRG